MKSILKQVCLVVTAVVISLGFVACSKNKSVSVNLEGKWIHMSENHKELLIINADHTLFSTGADESSAWIGVKGKIELDGDKFSFYSEDGDNSFGTYSLENNKLRLDIIDDGCYVYNKMEEDFSIEGSWKCVKTMPFIKAVKDEIKLPVGSIVNGEMIPTVLKTANIKGEFIEGAIKAYFRDVKFVNGKMEYKVVKDGEEMTMTKNYRLVDNMMKITGKVGSVVIDNEFMVFQNPDTKESYMFLTKDNIADMFIGYALMLREGQVSEGSVEALDVFRKEFVEVFENFAAIIYLQKQ